MAEITIPLERYEELIRKESLYDHLMIGKELNIYTTEKKEAFQMMEHFRDKGGKNGL